MHMTVTTKRLIVGASLLAIGLLRPAQAATRTWTNTVSSSWETANNWNPVGAPTNTDDIVVAATGPFTMNINNTTANTGDTSTWLR